MLIVGLSKRMPVVLAVCPKLQLLHPFSSLSPRDFAITRSSLQLCGVAQISSSSDKATAAVKEALESVNIRPLSFDKGEHRAECPKCKGGDGWKGSLRVNIFECGAIWQCHNRSCKYSGSFGGKGGPALKENKVPKCSVAQNESVLQVYRNDLSHSPMLQDMKQPPFYNKGQAMFGKNEAKCSQLTSFVRESRCEEEILDTATSTTTVFQPTNKDVQVYMERELCPLESLAVPCSMLVELSDELKLYFQSRCISENTLLRNKIKQTFKQDGIVIVFPYLKDNKVVNLKYRTIKKKGFWQEKNALKVFYGLDDVKNANHIIIVEGEIDKLSMEEAGFICCVSVPDGAPGKVSHLPLPRSQDKKFEYIWNCEDCFEKATHITLATDADGPGQVLAEELARRFGRERCWRVMWPHDSDGKICKDANEVLTKLGKEALRRVVLTAEPYPIHGLFTFSDFFKDLDNYYYAIDSSELGVSTGWEKMDAFYKIVPGELTLVTGIPSSGKSEWIDAVICNLVENNGWSFGLCSMENNVREHARKLLEKHLKKPFFDTLYSNGVPRMTWEELQSGKEWLYDNFSLIRCEDDRLPSIDWILQRAKAAVFRHGIRGLVIDPYNELDHHRASNQSETEYVSQMLTKIKRFAQHYGCHVWFVAHPRQMQAWTGGAPSIYDISGSAHFINKCDNGIVVHRNRDPRKGPIDLVQILIKKVRNKAAGTMGEVFLHYDKATGLYSD